MSIITTRAQRRLLAKDNSKLGDKLVEIPRGDWPPGIAGTGRVRVWRSRDFLVQQFEDPHALARLSVCRTTLVGDRWQDGITWDQLQAIKGACGFANRDAVEIYPDERDVVNVANMRHLWVLRHEIPFAWRERST